MTAGAVQAQVPVQTPATGAESPPAMAPVTIQTPATPPATEQTPAAPPVTTQQATPAVDETAQWNVLNEAFPYEAKDVTMQSMAKDLSQKTGIPVIANRPSGGSFAVDNSGGSVRDLLDRLERDGRTLWWWDGGAVHLEAPDTTTSALIPLQGVSSEELVRQVSILGIDEVKYPILSNPDARFVRVVGPQGYVDALRELIGNMAAAKAPAASGQLPVIIRGRSPAAGVPQQQQQQQQGQFVPGQFVPSQAPVATVPGTQAPTQYVPVDPRQIITPRTQ